MLQDVSPEILSKYADAIQAARNYYVLNQPTGMLDRDYNRLELEARQDGLELRDYVYSEIQGERVQNESYLTKVEKTTVNGSMLEAVKDFSQAFFNANGYYPYWIPKYDGSSLIGYYNSVGECIRVVTVGGMNLTGEGIDQTIKFKKYFPNLQGSGIKALQCECLIKLEHGFGEKSRQKANGLVNSKFLESEVELYCNLRCFRYFTDNYLEYYDTMSKLAKLSYVNLAGDVKFSPGLVMTTEQLVARQDIEKDIWETETGTFLVDGIVAYDKSGVCCRALKYHDAGRGETTKVIDIKWNDNSSRGKDSWSANAIIEPIELRGSKVTKPTVGSISKMISTCLSPGASVTVILANSTIPQVKDVCQPGNGDYKWPTCSCGYQMGPNDIFGSLLKCGNPDCSHRYNNMLNYLNTLNGPTEIDLNKLLIIDRFDWHKVLSPNDYNQLILDLVKAVSVGDFGNYSNALNLMTTKNNKVVRVMSDLQFKNLTLVLKPSFRALTSKVTWQ